MPEYLVVWEMNITADSPREAAEKALAIHREPESVATVFYVYDENGDKTVEDLLDDEYQSSEA